MTTPTDTRVDAPVLDETWLATPRRRSRMRLGLTALLGAALCFLGGVLVQQHFGAPTSSPSAGGLPPGLASAAPEGFPGNLPGGEDALSGADQEAGRRDDTRSVIGTVVRVRGNVWVVRDLGGERHRVRLTDQTDVVRETDLDPEDVRVGDGVDISGTDGDLLGAERVTLR